MDQKVFYNEQYGELKSLIQKYNASDIFLVRGKGSFASSGAEKFINDLTEDTALESFFDFDINPQLIDLKKGVELFKKGNFKIIIAIGGGSVLDMAKLISIFAHQLGNFGDIVKGKHKINEHKTPLLAIPTTAGTGAEATHFAVLYISKQKFSVAHSLILPDFVFISNQFSLSVNAYLTACTGMDAFCQAIESAWSVNGNNESLGYAQEASSMVWNFLPDAVLRNDKLAKEKLQYAAYLAGKAINITKTTAPHAISYAFTSYYGIPHGHAVALSLPYFVQFNYHASKNNCTDSRGPEDVRKRINNILAILNCNIDEAEHKIQQFMLHIGLQFKVRELIQGFDTKTILNNVNTERLNNNPRKVTSTDLEKLIDSIM